MLPRQVVKPVTSHYARVMIGELRVNVTGAPAADTRGGFVNTPSTMVENEAAHPLVMSWPGVCAVSRPAYLG